MKKGLITLIIICFSGFVFFSICTSIVSAANGDDASTGESTTSEGGGVGLGAPIGGESKPANFADYVNKVYDFAVVFGISLAVLMIIFSGYKYMSSSGDPQSLAEAKELLVGAIVGLILILLTRLILASIDPNLLRFPTRPSVFPTATSNTSGGTSNGTSTDNTSR